MPKSTLRNIVRRWSTVVTLVVVGSMIGLFLLQPLGSLADRIYDLWSLGDAVRLRLPRWQIYASFIVLSVLNSFPMMLLIRLGGLRFRHLRYSFRYPPTWLAAVISALPVGITAHVLFQNRAAWALSLSVWIQAYGTLLAGSILAVLFDGRHKTDCEKDKGQKNSQLPPGINRDAAQVPTGDALMKWIEREAPITCAADDYFGLAAISDRIVRRIGHDRLKTFGLVGPYGCGKTSLRNLIEGRLKGTKTWTCRVGGWGLTSSGAAEYVLECALEHLAVHVECTPISGLPAHYQNALRAAQSPWTGAIGALFGQTNDPIDTLRQIDDVLDAVGARLIIFLEDLERNRSDEKVLSQLSALLDRLRHLKRVSFVLAIGVDSGADLTKLCDYIELLPALVPRTIRPIIMEFRNRCHSAFSDDIRAVDDATDPVFAAHPLSSLFDDDWDGSDFSVLTAVTGALKTPRLLKTALRQTWAVWQQLHGEINFDDLLVAASIRASAPEAYGYLVAHVDSMRELSRKRGIAEKVGGGAREASRRDEMRTQWHAELRRMALAGGWDADPIMALIGRLFPVWSHDACGNDGSEEQRIRAASPTDYWRRLLAEDVGGDLGDQEYLKALTKWTASSKSEFIDKLAIYNEWTLKLEQFSTWLKNEDIHKLCGELFEVLLRKHGVSANRDSSKSFFGIWRVTGQRRPRGGALFVVREIKKALATSLRFSLDIEHYWGDTHAVQLVSLVQTKRIRTILWLLCKQTFDSPEKIIASMDPKWPWSLHHLILHQHLRRSLPSTDWGWLIPILLDAAESKPDIMIPQLATLISESTHTMDRTGHVHSINEKVVDELFSGDGQRKRLWKILAEDLPPGPLDDNMVAKIRFVQGEAAKRL